MNTSWTPGPWVGSRTLIGSSHGDPNRREVYGTDRQRADDKFPTRSVCRLNEFLHEWTPEDEANFNLILAAPTLAAFVEKVRATIAPACTEHGDDYLNEGGGHDKIEALVGERAIKVLAGLPHLGENLFLAPLDLAA